MRRGEFVGPRLPGQEVDAWVRAAQGDRDRSALAHVSPADDVADPYGGPYAGYEVTAAELDDLTGALAAPALARLLSGRPGTRPGASDGTRRDGSMER